MKQLNIALLGVPQLKLDDERVPKLVSRKARALFFYLAASGHVHTRQALAGLLWDNMPEESARRNLRVALVRLRNVLGDYLLINRRSLAINPDAPIWLDVTEFEQCLSDAEPDVTQLQRAASLYRGRFLADFFVRDAPLFEEWQRPLQERYRQMAIKALYRLSVHHTQQQQYSTGISYTQRLLALEPWMEEAHRQMMLLQALSGQRSAALAQYETCRTLLDEELGVAPSDTTTRLYQQILDEEFEADHEIDIPVSPHAPAPFQAPAKAPHFVGRTAILDGINDLFAQASLPQIHALVGMGGIGKSAVAVQIAHAVRELFEDGVLWADAARAEPMAILESWAQAYGYDFTRIGDVESMAAAFRGMLAEKSVLIVLDDVTSVSRVRPLLPNGPNNQVLITTRNQDLARVLNAQVWPVKELSQENGLALLTEILGTARIQAEPEAAAAICTQLQNLPLAVEITAQRLKSRPRRRLEDMVQRLRDEQNRLSLLTISDQAVRASFTVIWEALDAAHRRIFALLGLYNGRSFTADAIAHIADLDRYTTEDRLFTLAALSLLREADPGRYRQHPLLADFAREQLGEDAGVENGRFATYYLHFAQQHQQDYDTLRPEWENMMAGIETAHNHKLWQTVIDFANTLHDAWFTRGRFTQARQGYQLALQAAEKFDNQPLLANFSLQLGRACIKQSDYDPARSALDKCGLIFDKIGNQFGVASVKFELAGIAVEQAEFEVARSLLKECLSICETGKSEEISLADVLYRLADVEYSQGSTTKEDLTAEKMLKQSLELYRASNNKLGIIRTMRYLATINTTSKKDFKQAQQYIEEGLRICTELGDKHEQSILYYNMAGVFLYSHLIESTDTLNNAREIAQHGLTLNILFGDIRSQAQSLWLLCRIEFAAGNYATALEFGQQAKNLVDQIEDTSGRIFVRQYLAKIYLAIEQTKDACQELQLAHALAESIRHPLSTTLAEELYQNNC